MNNRHVFPAYTWVSFSLWLAFPNIMTIIATISAFLIAATVSYLTYAPGFKTKSSAILEGLSFSDLRNATK